MKSQTNQAELKCLVLIGNWYQKQSLQLHSQLMNKLRLDAISTISITLSPFISVSMKRSKGSRGRFFKKCLYKKY